MVEKGLFRLKDPSIPVKSEQNKVSAQEVISTFGFDYKPIVKERLKAHGVDFNDQDLNFFEIAQPHDGSNAVYLLEQIIGEHWVFLSFLSSNRITSEHSHDSPVEELYDPLAGNALLLIDGESSELSKEKGPLAVSAGRFHQLQTGETPILTLIVMKNSAGVSRDKLHIRK